MGARAATAVGLLWVRAGSKRFRNPRIVQWASATPKTNEPAMVIRKRVVNRNVIAVVLPGLRSAVRPDKSVMMLLYLALTAVGIDH